MMNASSRGMLVKRFKFLTTYTIINTNWLTIKVDAKYMWSRKICHYQQAILLYLGNGNDAMHKHSHY